MRPWANTSGQNGCKRLENYRKTEQIPWWDDHLCKSKYELNLISDIWVEIWIPSPKVFLWSQLGITRQISMFSEGSLWSTVGSGTFLPQMSDASPCAGVFLDLHSVFFCRKQCKYTTETYIETNDCLSLFQWSLASWWLDDSYELAPRAFFLVVQANHLERDLPTRRWRDWNVHYAAAKQWLFQWVRTIRMGVLVYFSKPSLKGCRNQLRTWRQIFRMGQLCVWNLAPFGWGYLADIEQRAALLNQPNSATRTADPGGMSAEDSYHGIILATLLRAYHIPWSAPTLHVLSRCTVFLWWRLWGPGGLWAGDRLNECGHSICQWLGGSGPAWLRIVVSFFFGW